MVDAGRAVAFAPRFRLDRIRVGPDRMGARRPVRATLRRANRSCDHRFWLAMPCAETGKRHDLPCVRGAPDMPIDDHEPAVCGCLISVRQLRLICVPWTPRDEAAMRAAIRLFRSVGSYCGRSVPIKEGEPDIPWNPSGVMPTPDPIPWGRSQLAIRSMSDADDPPPGRHACGRLSAGVVRIAARAALRNARSDAIERRVRRIWPRSRPRWPKAGAVGDDTAFWPAARAAFLSVAARCLCGADPG